MPDTGIEVAVTHLVLHRLELGLDIADEAEVRGFVLRVVGLAGHGDVTLGPFLTDRRVQLAGRNQPLSRSPAEAMGIARSCRYQGSICSQVLSSTFSGSHSCRNFRGTYSVVAIACTVY